MHPRTNAHMHELLHPVCIGVRFTLTSYIDTLKLQEETQGFQSDEHSGCGGDREPEVRTCGAWNQQIHQRRVSVMG